MGSFVHDLVPFLIAMGVSKLDFFMFKPGSGSDSDLAPNVEIPWNSNFEPWEVNFLNFFVD